ncbi:MAG: hypothetical protein WC544_02970 [Patescibacteria group bacterium]
MADISLQPNRPLTAGLVIVFVLILFGIAIGYTLLPHHTSLVSDFSPEVKPVVLASFIDDVIFFDVPISWNVYENGDVTLVNSLSEIGGPQKAAMSVSVGAYPITYSDMNWNQVDIYLTDGDLIGESAPKETDGEKINIINLDNFTGYTVSTFDPHEPESKGNPDGLAYYLCPKTANPTWNIILIKQSSGDEDLNNGLNVLLNSLRFQNYREYINEINKIK